MNHDFLRFVANHLWQSTLFAAVAGLLTLALHNSRARIRHCLWLTASCKFLVPFSVFVALGGQFAWRTASPSSQSTVSLVAIEFTEPFARTCILPLTKVGLWWCNFEIIRRPHSNLMKKLKADPKAVADQLGHTVDLNHNVYTQTRVETRLPLGRRFWSVNLR